MYTTISSVIKELHIKYYKLEDRGVCSAGILEQSVGARNRVGIGFVVPGRQAT